MHVNVGPFRYQVQLVHGHIRHEGEDCLGLCDNLAQRILISDVPPETQRVQVFFHELMHAWWYHFGVDATDEEQVVDLVGVAMTDFLIEAVRTMRLAALTRGEREPAANGPESDAQDEAGGHAGPGHSGGPGPRVDRGDSDDGPAPPGGHTIRTKRARPGRRFIPAAAAGRGTGCTQVALKATPLITGLVDGPLPVLRIQPGKELEIDWPDDVPADVADPVEMASAESSTDPTAAPSDALAPTSVDADDRWVIRIYDPSGVATVARRRAASS